MHIWNTWLKELLCANIKKIHCLSNMIVKNFFPNIVNHRHVKFVLVLEIEEKKLFIMYWKDFHSHHLHQVFLRDYHENTIINFNMRDNLGIRQNFKFLICRLYTIVHKILVFKRVHLHKLVLSMNSEHILFCNWCTMQVGFKE